jgi:hypothetical protein
MAYHVKTPNFSYILHVKEKTSPFHTIEFTVGESQKPCLDASLFLPDNDSRVQSIINTCTLHKIDAIEQCALEYDQDKSFGTELLYSFINIVTVNFPHINTIKLSDASYIPCNRDDGDTLDLLTYSIALYGQTWYEIKAGARLPPGKLRDLYESNIKTFIDPKTKSNISFSELLSHMLSTSIGREVIGNDILAYEIIYEEKKTLPDFFTALSKKIPKHMKCKFFKGWLEYFIGLHVYVGRDWLIDIRENSVLQNLNVINVSKSKPMRSKTRKCRR